MKGYCENCETDNRDLVPPHDTKYIPIENQTLICQDCLDSLLEDAQEKLFTDYWGG